MNLPLSYSQGRLFVLEEVSGPSARYNVPVALGFGGVVDGAALGAALSDVVLRHEVLRTVYRRDARGEACQVVLEPEAARVDLPVAEVGAADLDAALAREAERVFDLSCEIPLRVRLIRTAGGDVLLLVIHHIACDGLSMAPLLRDLSEAYAARLAGREPGWAPLPVQYADYTLWQRETLGEESDPGSEMARQLGFWREALAGLPERMELPLDHPRPARPSGRGGQVPVSFGAALSARLAGLARESRASLFMVVQAALSAVLSRLGAGTDIALGTVVAGRTDEALDDLVGFFVNTLVLRTDVSGNPSFGELVDRAREGTLAAFANQDLPFDRLVEALNPSRSPASHPLFQVMLSLQGEGPEAIRFGGLDASLRTIPTESAKFDLAIQLSEGPAGLTGEIEYASDLFERATVEALGQRLVRFLEAASADPSRPVGSIDLLSGAERRLVLEAWNATAQPVSEESVVSLFAAQVAAGPDRPALRWAGGALSYAELDREADRLAARLAGLGAGPEAIVGICLDRSWRQVVSVLGVLKAGAAYLPLDPREPPDRLALILEDARPLCVIADAQTASTIPDGVKIITPDGPNSIPPHEDERGGLLHRGPVHPDGAAYVIYTSGSTGRPKGVVVTHRNITELAADASWRDGNQERVLLHSPFSFDACTYELWAPLLSGGCVVVAPDDIHELAILRRVVADERITGLFLTAGLFNLVAEEDPACLAPVRAVWSGGDVVSAEGARRVLARNPHLAVVNAYGPTEATMFATCWRVTDPSQLGDGFPIGRPIANTRVYVLDAHGQPVPPNVPGELHIAGTGLARGYLDRPDLTAERFVFDPFGPPGTRMYRTGDLVKWRRDGAIVFLGRVDQQLKIRGFRIEPGEIEAALLREPGIAQAAVIAREDRPGDKRLVGYVVAREGALVSGQDLIRRLAAALPDYMVPAAIMPLPALPLTANGKLDRKALPAPDFAVREGRRPASQTEERLAALFAELLGLPEVPVEASFFDLGGHSLLAARLASRIAAAFDTECPIRTLFEAQSVEDIAKRIERGIVYDPTDQSSLAILLPLRRGGSKPPLFCIHPGAGLSWCYRDLVRHLDPEVPVYGLQSLILSDDGAAPGSVAELASLYLKEIRSIQPSPPYNLVGWSFGGLVAQEMAAQIRSCGSKSGMLCLIDCHILSQDPDSNIDNLDVINSIKNHIDAFGLCDLDDAELVARLARATAYSYRLATAHEPRMLHGPAFVFTAKLSSEVNFTKWDKYITSTIEKIDFECDHYNIIRSPYIKIIAKSLNILY